MEGGSKAAQLSKMSDRGGRLDSDKTKDIRTNNIIAAKGMHTNKS
jgi:hypothetical protein